MASNFFKIKTGANIQPVAGSTVTVEGDFAYNLSTHQLEVFGAAAAEALATASNTLTLTNKVLSGNTATNLISGSGTLTLNTTGTITVPNGTDTLVGKATTDTLTNKTLSGNTATNLVSGSGTLTLNTTGTITVPSATDTLVGKATTDVFTNKTFDVDGSGNSLSNVANASIKAAAAIALNKLAATTVSRALVSDASGFVSPATTTAVEIGYVNGVTSAIQTQLGTKLPTTVTTTGDMIYSSSGATASRLPVGTANQVITSVGGIPTWSTVNAGAKNYIQYNNFANNATTGWGLGTATLTSALPTGVPTFGSGASGNLTLSTTASGALAGTYSLSLASSAATTAGNFIASDPLTLDIEDQAKVMAFKFYYSPTVSPTNGNWSGTSSNSFGCAIYDVTNSAWIIPAGVFNLVQSTGVGIAQGTFQTPSNMTSFRFVVYNANATSGAITLLYDDFYLGPQALAFGPAMTDMGMNPWTPTSSWSTNCTFTGLWGRRGDYLVAQAHIALAGAPTSASLTITTPFTIDTAKVNATHAGIAPPVGFGSGLSAGTAKIFEVQYNNSTSVSVVYQSAVTGTATAVNATSPATFANGDYVDIWFEVPISGWSSNTVMSADTSTSVVAATYQTTDTSTTITATATAIAAGWTKVIDTNAAFGTGTGIFTVPVAGVYRVSASFSLTTTTWAAITNKFTAVVFKNGSSYARLGAETSGATGAFALFASGSQLVPGVPGDTLEVRFTSDVNTTLTGTAANNTVSFERLSGPAVVAASESVNARYFSSSTTINGSLATVVWTTKDFDSHNAMSSGVYTIPVSGKYQVNSSLGETATYALNNSMQLQIQKNGVAISNFINLAAAAVTQLNINLSDIISCVAGDTIRIQTLNQGTSPAIGASTAQNYVSICRVGN